MSWWNTGTGNDVIGDEAADLVREALTSGTNQAAPGPVAKPSVTELLVALEEAIQRDGGRHLAGGEGRPPCVDAVLKDGSLVAGKAGEDRERSHALAASLLQSLSRLEHLYQNRWGRKPALSEWLQAIEFVLRYRPEDFLSDGVEHPVGSLRIRSEG